MAKKRGGGHGGGHGWFVTFADLMALLMSFFVMLVAFSTQDSNKLQIVAGSMRDAFGVQTQSRYSGIIEVQGLPTRPKLKNAAHIPPEEASNTPTPDEQDRQRLAGARIQGRPRLRSRDRRPCGRRCRTCRNIDRTFQAHHDRGDPAGPQYRNHRPGWPLDVRRGQQDAAMSARGNAHREGWRCRAAAGRCHTGSRSPAIRRSRHAAAPGLRALGVCPPIAPMRCARYSSAERCLRLSQSPIFAVAGEGGYPAAFPGRPLHGGQSPRDHHDARMRRSCRRLQALNPHRTRPI